MKIKSRWILFCMTLLVAFSSFVHPSAAAERGLKVQTVDGYVDFYKDYHAIVIGVSDYDYWPKIPNAVEDAREVSTKLLSMGYNVQLITDPNSADLNFILTRIAWKKGKEKNRALLIYFAGHGETVDLADGTKLGYIIPKDGPLYDIDPFAFDTKAISMKDIEMLALKIKSRHVLMLFDSCFSGSIFGLKRAAPRAIRDTSAKPVRQFITSGDANEQVPDQSMFKICFLQALEGYADYNKDGYLTGSELGLYLQENVIKYTRGNQHPQYGKINNPLLDKGDFVFKMTPKDISIVSTVQKRSDDNIDNAVELEGSDENHNSGGLPSDRTSLASIPNEVGNRIFSEYKLALFPWEIKNYPFEIFIGTIADHVKKLSDFRITQSYYDLSIRGNLNIKKINFTSKSKLWKKKSFLEGMQPDTEMVRQYGQRFGVDAVILGAASVSPWPETIKYLKVYLIDVKTGEDLSYKTYSRLYLNNGQFKEKFSTELYKIFNDYRAIKQDMNQNTIQK